MRTFTLHLDFCVMYVSIKHIQYKKGYRPQSSSLNYNFARLLFSYFLQFTIIDYITLFALLGLQLEDF